MTLRSVFTAVLGMMMLSESAFALSCARPDIVKTLEDAKASEKLYYVLVGKFTAQPRAKSKNKKYDGYIIHEKIRSPLEDQFRPKPPVITRSTFQGFSVGKTYRQDSHLKRFPVDIETSCAGPWCSELPSSDQDIIAFVEARDGQAPLLKISPCPYWTFGAELAQVQKIRQCLDSSCEPEAPHW